VRPVQLTQNYLRLLIKFLGEPSPALARADGSANGAASNGPRNADGLLIHCISGTAPWGARTHCAGKRALSTTA